MDRSREFMRLEIEGRWSAEEFGRCFFALAQLYNLRMYLELLREEAHDLERLYFRFFEFGPRSDSPRSRRIARLLRNGLGPWAIGTRTILPFWHDEQIERLSDLIEPDERLDVRQVSYASPGAADLGGIGAVIGHLKEFILALIERRDSKRHRDLMDDRAEIENERMRIENAKQFVALARDLGYSETEARQVTLAVDRRQETLIQLIDQRKITGVSTPHNLSEAP